MTASKAIGIAACGLVGAVVLLVGSILHTLFTGNYWLWAALCLGGTGGLGIGYLLTKARDRNSDLEKQLDTCNTDLKKSVQDCRLLTETYERDWKASIQRQALHEKVFDAMDRGMLVVGRHGEILLVNRPGRSLLRIGDDFSEELSKIALPFFDDRKGDSISRHGSMARITLGDGTNSLFGFSTSTLDSDGSLLVVFQDMTDTVGLQEKRRRAMELSVVGELASRLSHEIMNPLASILVAVKILVRGIPQSSQHGTIVQLMSEEVNSLKTIVGELLDLARPKPSSLGIVEVEPLLQRCVDARNLQAVRLGVQLELVPFPVSVAVLADDQAMLRALGSMIQNALDACSTGDCIRIGWRQLDRSGREELVPGFPGNVVSLFVEDSGEGIPDELSSNESRLFEAFVSTKVSGTGLGLTLARDIVEENGGVIAMSSLPTRGTTAQILLPVLDSPQCWEWNSDRSVDCTSCHVPSTGAGRSCWRREPSLDDRWGGRWPERCLKCDFSRASRLAPFYRSRLVVSEVE